MTLCLIPARGGSKRIPRKNIKQFGEKPMMAHSIMAAQASGCFSEIIVSTDDEEIANIARQYGASVPFMRPDKLANDYAGTVEVVSHAVRHMQELGWIGSEVCCLYATAPFVSPKDLQRGLTVLRDNRVDYAVSVTTFPFPIQRALQCGVDGKLAMFNPDNVAMRSQDLVEAWHDAGQFYWGKTSAWLQEKQIFTADVCAVPLPRYRVQDIDTVEDWLRAEILWRILRETGEIG